MIKIINYCFKIDTRSTTYLFSVTQTGQLQNLYYGKRIDDAFTVDALSEPCGAGGTSVVYERNKGKSYLNNLCMEFSGIGKGDYKEPFAVIRDKEDNIVSDFVYEKHEFLSDFEIEGLPNSMDKDTTLKVTLCDSAKHLKLHLFYSTFSDSDVIVKSSAIENCSNDTVYVDRLCSSQLDLPSIDYVLDTFDGAWAKERYVNSRELSIGVFLTDSKCGVSSNMHNPFVMLKDKKTTFFTGDCYGINLVYSGNHSEIVEATAFSKTHILNGMNDYGFCWHLQTGETFFAPECTLCFSDKGTNGISSEYHNFINRHIVPKQWQYKPRPVLVNNWEATMFDFTEKKLLAIAKEASALGAELFVLDDGWFGKRRNDKKGLGDWYVNTSLFPNGLGAFQKKIAALNMQFGLWMEPEMVNCDSDLYRAHPSWAVKHPDYEPSFSRNQLLLDLCNDEVVNYLIDKLSDILQNGNLSYVKWDFNRPMSDFYSPTLKGRQGEFFHRYMLGFYKLIKTLTERFPDILFESCASGGNRVDLGILRYMPQFWASDNTDSFDRVKIQEGTLCCYPQSTMGSHVSASPNMQTLRQSFIDDRFNTACIGLLGYELDLTALSKVDKAAVKAQIAWYKKYRDTLQFGNYYRTSSVFEGRGGFCVVNADKTQAVCFISNTIAETIPKTDILKTVGLNDSYTYKFETRVQQFNVKAFGHLINMVLPVKINEEGKLADMINNNFSMKSEHQCYVLSGNVLNNCGVRLYQQNASTGYDGKLTRIMLDFGSRLYSIDKVDK